MYKRQHQLKDQNADQNTAQGYELDAIAACTIGGVSTTGGVGTVPGVLVGVLVFELMKVCLLYTSPCPDRSGSLPHPPDP